MADRDRAEVCSEGVRSGLFEIDLSTGELYKGGRKVALQEQPFQVLALLVGRPGELVTRLEMQNRLWPGDTYVGFQEGLNTAIRKLRLAFGDSAENPRFIQTVPRRGYRFIAPVERQKSDRTIAPGLHIVDVSVMPAPILPMSDGSMLLPELSPEQLPKRKRSRLRFLVAGVLLIVATLVWMFRPSLSRAQVPRGWFIAGSKPEAYESSIDAGAIHEGHPSAYLKSKKRSVEGFGTLMQSFSAHQYLGKRVRFTAFAKIKRQEDRAVLWMRIDKGSEMLALDNIGNRTITGSIDWRQYEVVLDVPENAIGIALGVLLNGSGQVWITGAKFEPVGPGVLPTRADDAPNNLGFEQ